MGVGYAQAEGLAEHHLENIQGRAMRAHLRAGLTLEQARTILDEIDAECVQALVAMRAYLLADRPYETVLKAHGIPVGEIISNDGRVRIFEDPERRRTERRMSCADVRAEIGRIERRQAERRAALTTEHE